MSKGNDGGGGGKLISGNIHIYILYFGIIIMDPEDFLRERSKFI